jgi:asparagine synthase (glutamine-hydrolysing)
VVQYFVFKAVKEKGVVVVLGGQGADEIFAGYDYYFDYYYKKLAGTFKWISLYKELKKKKTFENKSFSLKEYRKYLIKGVASSFIPVFLKNPLLKRKIYFMNPKSTKKYVNQKRVGYARNYDLRNFLISEITNFSIPPLMAYEDRNSMAHSIEARVPFLDLDVVDIALEIASKLHLNEGMYKFVLRNAINGELPDKIAWNNKKIGFEVPEKEWMLGIEDEIQNLLQNDLWIYNLIDKTFILDLLLNFKNLDKFHLRILWRCYSTQLWYNNFQKLS